MVILAITFNSDILLDLELIIIIYTYEPVKLQIFGEFWTMKNVKISPKSNLTQCKSKKLYTHMPKGKLKSRKVFIVVLTHLLIKLNEV